MFKGTHNKYWFDCVCGHEFESALCNITTSNQWCPYCSNPPKKYAKKIVKVVLKNHLHHTKNQNIGVKQMWMKQVIR